MTSYGSGGKIFVVRNVRTCSRRHAIGEVGARKKKSKGITKAHKRSEGKDLPWKGSLHDSTIIMNSSNVRKQGKLIESLPLFSERSAVLLQRALEVAKTTEDPETTSFSGSSTYAPATLSSIPARYASSSDDEAAAERENEDDSSSSDSEGSVSSKDQHDPTNKKQPPPPETSSETTSKNQQQRNDTIVNGPASRNEATQHRKKNNKTTTTMDQRQKELAVRNHVDSIPCVSLKLPDEADQPFTVVLELPACLLSKEAAAQPSAVAKAECLLELSRGITGGNGDLAKPIVVLFLRSGRFAGAVFAGHDGRCIHHTTSSRYTVRKGQGKAQSAQDGQRRPKSMGAQLRRQGEVQLQEDVAAALLEWRDSIHRAALILISVPKTMKKSLFGADGSSGEMFLRKDDPRIRRVPLDLGRPSFENVCLIHSVLTTLSVRERVAVNENEEQLSGTNNKEQDLTEKKEQSVKDVETPKKRAFVIDAPPLTALHIAAQNGDAGAIRIIFENCSDDADALLEQVINAAGETLMTPLHYAAESSIMVDPENAAGCVRLLLEEGHADPCLVDARGRVPYFLASQDKVRDAFRIARAILGEGYCDWDASKVGPPLTMDEIDRKNEREAEKKRKKRARQKEKKAKEKADQKEAEERLKEAQEREKQEEEAKRVRDGLQGTKSSGGVCDFCQTVCKGRKRTQMFQRLGYSYCSTECVQKHKRELMAAAATARFGAT